MRRRKNVSTTTRFALILCALLLIANFALGFVLLEQSKNAMKTLIDGHMIYISSAAASNVDGDFIRDLTEDDVGSDEYKEVLDSLVVFQKNFRINEVDDLEYIYIVRRDADGNFVFIVDPDPDDPADYGQETVFTDALISAENGTPAIDEDATEDEWGRYYTSYSPIFDSDGKVAGVVGIDFNADWYESQIAKHTSTIVIIALMSLFVGALIVFLVTTRMRKRFNLLSKELSALSDDVGELADEILSRTEFSEDSGDDAQIADTLAAASSDPVEQIDSRVKQMRVRVGRYINFMHKRAYMDLMTGTGNRSAYVERTEKIGKKIESGGASFAVAVFDINRLKETNDTYGHDCGDVMILDAAGILKEVFGAEDVYRTGGDEFVALVEGATEESMKEALVIVSAMLEMLTTGENKREHPLSLSKGAAAFVPGEDKDYKSVFVRADRAMYNDKDKYYDAFGETYRSSRPRQSDAE